MKRRKILIVEDEESLLRLESILLTSKGFEVIGAMDGPSALKRVVSDRPDLVLLDVMLPEMNGFEVCRQIRANPIVSQTPVVMLTAKKNGQDFEQGKECGANAYITKPFKSAKVIEIIEQILSESCSSGPGE
ncbi:response regulator transcription factor [Geobacter sp. DSM 9736]|uniref:response regulator transcription factor n=1 Tax=Geobacter sp. DSM 9736 TaxID=1277350 RepID=UPI000B5135EF|nr:response regulator [Geobacter sp. DSM 9736]